MAHLLAKIIYRKHSKHTNGGCYREDPNTAFKDGTYSVVNTIKLSVSGSKMMGLVKNHTHDLDGVIEVINKESTRDPKVQAFWHL